MILSAIEQKRLYKIPEKALMEIYRLTDVADSLWNQGNVMIHKHKSDGYLLQMKAQKRYIMANKIYKKEVLFRKF